MAVVLIGAIILVVISSRKASRATATIERAASDHGWNFSKRTRSGHRWTIKSIAEMLPWRIETVRARQTDSSTTGSKVSSYLVYPSLAITSGSILVTNRLPIQNTAILKGASLGGFADVGDELQSVVWGSEEFKSQFIVLATDPTLTERLSIRLDSFLRTAPAREGWSLLGVNLTSKGLIIRTSGVKTVEAIESLIEFGTGTAEALQ